MVFFLSALWWIRIRGLYNFLMGGTAAAAKSSQSCPTLCNPIEGSPLGSSVPGILQARILEWVAISFSSAWKWKVKVKLLSHARLLATLSTAVYQAPPSMGFSGQEYWSGLPFPSPMGGTGYGENPVLLWWAGPCSVNLQSNFLLMGGAVLLLYSLAWAQTMIGVMATSSKRIYASILCLPALLLSVLLVTQQATVNPWLHQRFQNTHRQVWLSPLWAYCSCLLGPGAHKVLFVPSKRLWQVWSLIKHNWVPPTILVRLLLCPWMWGMFFGGFQHFAINRCSAASWKFSVLTGKDKHMSFYSAILEWIKSLAVGKWTQFPTLVPSPGNLGVEWKFQSSDHMAGFPGSSPYS